MLWITANVFLNNYNIRNLKKVLGKYLNVIN